MADREGKEGGRKKDERNEEKEGGTGWSNLLKNTHVSIHDVPRSDWFQMLTARFT